MDKIASFCITLPNKNNLDFKKLCKKFSFMRLIIKELYISLNIITENLQNSWTILIIWQCFPYSYSLICTVTQVSLLKRHRGLSLPNFRLYYRIIAVSNINIQMNVCSFFYYAQVIYPNSIHSTVTLLNPIF